MIATSEKSREDKVRRQLNAQGYTLRKSRAQTWTVDNQQGYMIVETSTNSVAAGGNFDMTLEDIERFAAE